jgi:plasmid stability protein
MKTLQIRHVPEDVHRVLKSRAALAGMSLSDYALAELRRVAATPTEDEVFGRIAARRRGPLAESAADAVRAERAAR